MLTWRGVVPELASRDHVRKTVPLIQRHCASRFGRRAISTRWPIPQAWPRRRAAGRRKTAGRSLAFARNVPAIPVHHMGRAFAGADAGR